MKLSSFLLLLCCLASTTLFYSCQDDDSHLATDECGTELDKFLCLSFWDTTPVTNDFQMLMRPDSGFFQEADENTENAMLNLVSNSDLGTGNEDFREAFGKQVSLSVKFGNYNLATNTWNISAGSEVSDFELVLFIGNAVNTATRTYSYKCGRPDDCNYFSPDPTRDCLPTCEAFDFTISEFNAQPALNSNGWLKLSPGDVIAGSLNGTTLLGDPVGIEFRWTF